jgi:hypothetical protein
LKNKNVSPEILKELSQGNYQSLLNQYRAIEPFLSNKESIQSLDSLRSALVESAPEDVKT